MAVKSFILILTLLFTAFGSSPAQSVLAVTGATVIDVRDGSRTQDTVIVIEGDRIKAVGPAAKTPIPAGARVVEARGKYVIPGLWDVHTHIQNQRELDVFFPLLVAHGVVGIRDCEGLLPREFRDFGQQQQYAPHVVACGTGIDGSAPAGVADTAMVDELATQGVDFIKVFSLLPRERFLAIVAKAKQHGLPVAGHIPIAVGAAEASDLGLKSMEHLWEIALNLSSREAELRTDRLASLNQPLALGAFELALAFPPTEPLVSTRSEKKVQALFKKFAANHTWQVPTLVNFQVRGPALSGDPAFWDDPDLALVPKDWLDSWRPAHNKFLIGLAPAELPGAFHRFEATHRLQLDLVRRMHAAGVRFLAGTDVSQWNFTVPGASLHQELAQFVAAGFTPLEALQTATSNPAEFLGLADAGSIASGKRADLLILDADPTEDISNTRRIAAVVLGGRLIDRRELNRMLDDARRRAAEGPSG